MSATSVRRRQPSPERAAKYRLERDRIVRAAYRMIGAGSSTGASVQDILTEAGLSTRAFYRHFPSKDDLILFMYRADSERVARAMSEAVAGAESPTAALEAWVAEYLQVAYDSRRAAKARVLASREASAAAGFAEVHAAEISVQQGILQEVLEQGSLDGSFPFAEPAEDAYALHALVSSYVGARLFGGHDISFERARDHTVALFLRALGAQPAGLR